MLAFSFAAAPATAYKKICTFGRGVVKNGDSNDIIYRERAWPSRQKSSINQPTLWSAQTYFSFESFFFCGYYCVKRTSKRARNSFSREIRSFYVFSSPASELFVFSPRRLGGIKGSLSRGWSLSIFAISLLCRRECQMGKSGKIFRKNRRKWLLWRLRGWELERGLAS